MLSRNRKTDGLKDDEFHNNFPLGPTFLMYSFILLLHLNALEQFFK